MRVKKIISTLFILFVTLSICGDTTLITITPYSHGKVIIPYTSAKLHKRDINMWYNDTITFSSGIKITFMELNQMITRNYLAYGGLVFIDTISSVYYKFNDSLENNGHWDPSKFMQGMFKNTINNPDTKWNEAMAFPDSLAPCDTFIFESVEDPDTIIFAKVRAIYKIRRNVMDPMHEYTNSMECYNSILYVKDFNNNHIKIQIVEFKTVEQGPNGTGSSPDTIKMLWATDSCGDGIYKHDPTSKIPAKKTEAQTNKIFLSNNNGMPYLYLSNRLDADKEIKIEIYNLKGRRILQKYITCLKPVSLSQLHSGIYMAHIRTGSGKYIRNFVVTE